MKGIIIGNGPSIKWQHFGDSKEKIEKYQPFRRGPDLTERLKKEIVIIVNFGSRLLDGDHLVWTDSLAFMGYGDIENSKAQRWSWLHQKNMEEKALEHLDIRRFSFYSTREDILLSEYIEDGLHRNGSCVYSALNLGYILGLNPIFLVGCDWSAREGYLHFYDEKPTSQGFVESRAPRDMGSCAYVERLGANIQEFWINDDENDPRNFRIWNATEGGILQNFPKCTLEEALDMPDPIGDNILYEPDYSGLPAEIARMRQIHEANKRKLRIEVINLWRKKKGLPPRTK